MTEDERALAELDLPSVEEQRAALRGAVLEADRKHRIVFVGRFFQGPTGIVASLHRALESLGHTVFQLELARHKDAFDRSSGATGGYGPIFFRPEPVEAVFRAFRPEIVVFCAGGVVLDDEGAAWFRERGILTIGLTLSDPDVQDSVIDHVGRFDYHTTNAALSLERYHAEGHTNTFLMPFGIDRDYVLRDVPPAPELRADAICIGHAAGRPDRHEVMVRLAELVDVRVYGNGWPLPGAEPVAGDRLLQAAHEGLIHVNFPATRAGFTNVKCGVFETIGAGSILATARFDEMGRLFDYGDEILGYDSAEDLAGQIAALKEQPVELERLRRKGFARLLSEHLYEHRWLRLLADIEDDLETGASGKDEAERERLRGVLATTHGRPRHVIISGFYGAQNRGDDLLLDAIAASLAEADPDVNVIVAGVQAAEVERSSGYQSFRRTEQHVAERYASMATSVILGAGGLWHDYTIARAGGVSGVVTNASVSPSHLVQLPLMARAYGGSLHVYGMGVGPLQDEAAKAAVRLTGSIASSVTVRDEESLRLLGGVADRWAAQPVVAPDAVYSLPLEVREPGIALPERYIALNVRPWGTDPAVSARLRDMVLRVAAKRGLAVVALPMQTIDERALESERDDYAAAVPASMPGAEFLGVIERAAAVVSMRLHSNLLAHRLGTPAVGFSYDPKVRSHFAQLGRDHLVLDLEAQEHELEAALDAALDEGGLGERARARVAEPRGGLPRSDRRRRDRHRRGPRAGLTHRGHGPRAGGGAGADAQRRPRPRDLARARRDRRAPRGAPLGQPAGPRAGGRPCAPPQRSGRHLRARPARPPHRRLRRVVDGRAPVGGGHPHRALGQAALRRARAHGRLPRLRRARRRPRAVRAGHHRLAAPQQRVDRARSLERGAQGQDPPPGAPELPRLELGAGRRDDGRARTAGGLARSGGPALGRIEPVCAGFGAGPDGRRAVGRRGDARRGGTCGACGARGACDRGLAGRRARCRHVAPPRCRAGAQRQPPRLGRGRRARSDHRPGRRLDRARLGRAAQGRPRRLELEPAGRPRGPGRALAPAEVRREAGGRGPPRLLGARRRPGALHPGRHGLAAEEHGLDRDGRGRGRHHRHRPPRGAARLPRLEVGRVEPHHDRARPRDAMVGQRHELGRLEPRGAPRGAGRACSGGTGRAPPTVEPLSG
ncbi:polysaccharide pyruvyl transferase family protein [Agrococcus sp. SL85]|uniref:polysaccharide pyruvyl transferase family protein n=1 Tax=Agrococcus sp. SL85 TaxID=2995141 RepID=UPI00226D0ACC|nr:polysaccharide pyruvyl transferase family protein [Agrococcus sp. SL85]WAC66505.1 polysaccharide pyruvyl transferase family protein [Agrococcus sp. SL85]